MKGIFCVLFGHQRHMVEEDLETDPSILKTFFSSLLYCGGLDSNLEIQSNYARVN